MGLAFEPNPNPESSPSSSKSEGFFFSLALVKDCLGRLDYFFFEKSLSSSSSKRDFLPVFLGGSLLIAGIGGTDPELLASKPDDFWLPRGPPKGLVRGLLEVAPPKGLSLGGSLGTSKGPESLGLPPRGLESFLGF